MNPLLRRFLFIFFTLISLPAVAQVSPGDAAGLRNDSVPKQVLDHTLLRVSYQVNFLPFKQGNRALAQTVLDIGRQYTRFTDFYRLRSENVNDSLYKARAKSMEYYTGLMPLEGQVVWTHEVIHQLAGNSAQAFSRVFLDSYVYSYQPQLKWSLTPKRDTILGYPCKSATTTYASRNYTAWYTEDIPVSAGPSIFYGLPGLILKVADEKRDYWFKAVGLIKPAAGTLLYKMQLKAGAHVFATTRAKYRAAAKNFAENPALAISGTPGVTVNPKDLKDVEGRQWNPLELE